LFRKGYGMFKIKNKSGRAHRVAWQIYRGEIPAGLHVLHRCDTPSCVNPQHLFLGTNGDNVRDAVAKHGRKVPMLKGEQHPFARLTESQVHEIREIGDSQRGIAARYGISQSHVSGIKHRRFWRHI